MLPLAPSVVERLLWALWFEVYDPYSNLLPGEPLDVGAKLVVEDTSTPLTPRRSGSYPATTEYATLAPVLHFTATSPALAYRPVVRSTAGVGSAIMLDAVVISEKKAGECPFSQLNVGFSPAYVPWAARGVILGGRVDLANGCTSADALVFSQAALDAFAAEALVVGALPSAGSVTGCPISVSIIAEAPAAAYESLFRSIGVFIAGNNHRPASALRRVQFSVGFHFVDPVFSTLDWCTTVDLSVLPANDAPEWPESNPVAFVPENAAPQITVTIALDCTAAALSLSPASRAMDVCLTEADPLFAAVFADGPESGIAPFNESPQALQLLESYAVTLVNMTTDAPLAVQPAWPVTLVPAGDDAIWDCTQYAGTTLAISGGGGGSRPPVAVPLQPCWRVRYNVSTTPFDFESPACPRSIAFTVRITDTLRYIDVNGSVAAQANATDGTFNVSVYSVSDASFVRWAPGLGAGGREVVLDQREVVNGLAAGRPAALFAVYDQDANDIESHSFNVSGVFPVDGDALLGAAPAAAVFAIEPWPPSNGTWNSSFDPQAWAWVSTWTLVVRSGVLLSHLPATAFTIAVSLETVFKPNVSHVPATALSLTVPVRVVRSNAPVSWAAPTAVASVDENSPPGTVVIALVPTDADAEQSLSFELLSSNATVSGMLVLDASRSTRTVLVHDVGTGRAFYRNVTRGVNVVVAVDALDADAGDTVVALVIRVSDDGFFNNSRLARASPTSDVLILTVFIQNRDDKPVIRTVEHVPEAGLSVTGGDVLEITGDGLGLPAGTASVVNATLVNPSGDTWPFPSCVVVRRLVRLRCISPPGFGSALNVSVAVSGMTSVESFPTLAYQRPELTRVFFSFAGGEAVAPNSAPPEIDGAAYVTFAGLGLPPSADMGLFGVSLVQGPRTVAVANTSASCAFTGNRTARAGALTCVAPNIAGGIGVSGVVTAAGASSDAPATAYSPPVVTNVTVDDLVILIEGVNLGPAPGPLAYEASASFASALAAAAPWGVSNVFAGVVALDWVRYMAVPPGENPDAVDVGSPLSGEHYPARWCAAIGRRAACAVLHASNCSYLVSDALVSCALDPAGFGQGYYVQVSVSGQASAWGKGAAPFRYPRLELDDVATLSGAAPVRTDVGTAGGTLLLLRGRRLLQNNAILVEIGGVPTPPLASRFPGGVDGRSLVVAAPRGFGIVNLSVTLGGDTVYSWLHYADVALSSITLSQGTQDSQTRTYDIRGTAISSCALCYNASANAAACTPIATVVNASTCAMPDAVRATLGPRAAPSRGGGRAAAAAAGSPSGAVPSALEAPFTFALGTPPSPLAYVVISPDDTFVEIVTTGVDGTLTATSGASSSNLTFTFAEFSKKPASIARLLAGAGLATAGGSDISIAALDLPVTAVGSVLLAPADFDDAVFECPTVWASKVCIVNGAFSAPNCPAAKAFYSGVKLVVPAFDPDTGAAVSNATLVAAGISAGTSSVSADSAAAAALVSALGAENRTLYDSSSSSWVVHRAQPCYVRTWGGTCSAEGCSTTAQTITVAAPPWQGANSLSVSLGLTNSTDCEWRH